MADVGIDLGDLAAKADALRQDGATALFLAVDGKPAAVIAIADPIKATTAAALERLRDDGMRIVMLTGDNEATARRSRASSASTRSRPTCCPRTSTASSKS